MPNFREGAAAEVRGRSLAAVLAAIYGLKRIAQGGPGWEPAFFVVAGLAVGAAFVRRQRKLADPLIDLRLFRVPAFSASLATNTLGIFVIAGTFLFVAQYLQLVLGFSPLVAGLWSLPSTGELIAGSLLASPPAVSPSRPWGWGCSPRSAGLPGSRSSWAAPSSSAWESPRTS